jgi:biotin carboxyl carrier protein
MKLNFDSGTSSGLLEIQRNGEEVRAVVDGRSYELKASEPEPGLYCLKDETGRTTAFVSPTAEGESLVSIEGRSIEVRLFDPKRLRGSSSANEHGEGVAEIKTAMPGKVVRVLVAEGDEVEKGDGVIVVEAMKMQNEMKAPKSGKVIAVKAAEGAAVNAGEVLVAIE